MRNLLARITVKVDTSIRLIDHHIYVRQEGNELHYEMRDANGIRQHFASNPPPPPCFAGATREESLRSVVTWLKLQPGCGDIQEVEMDTVAEAKSIADRDAAVVLHAQAADAARRKPGRPKTEGVPENVSTGVDQP